MCACHWVCVHACLCMHVSMCVHGCMCVLCVCMHACLHVCVHACVCCVYMCRYCQNLATGFFISCQERSFSWNALNLISFLLFYLYLYQFWCFNRVSHPQKTGFLVPHINLGDRKPQGKLTGKRHVFCLFWLLLKNLGLMYYPSQQYLPILVKSHYTVMQHTSHVLNVAEIKDRSRDLEAVYFEFG